MYTVSSGFEETVEGHKRALRRLGLCLSLFCFILSACAGAQKTIRLGPVDPNSLSDGVFRGASRVGPVIAEVDVTVLNGAVIRIDVIRHVNMLGGAANPTIPHRIVSAQSTEVDVVSGATGSSIAIMQAVQDALDASLAGGKEAPE
ncbi:MAG: FMN-binding protein [Deltaproteobacteria bacterium]|nr:FMN-binding protein [Deltaproteobacteria bacterium]